MAVSIEQVPQLIAWAVAVFYGLQVCSGMVNLYLRYLDHLTIDRSDIRSLYQNFFHALIATACGVAFYQLPLTQAVCLILSVVLFVLIRRIHKMTSGLKKQWS